MAIDEHEAPHGGKAREVELLISNLLRVGVGVSLTLVIVGTIVGFVHHPEYLTQPLSLERLTKLRGDGGLAVPETLRDVWRGLLDFRGQAIIALGLILLIATPVVRVAVSILGFVYEKDKTYVVITSIVLGLLILSFVIGKVE